MNGPIYIKFAKKWGKTKTKTKIQCSVSIVTLDILKLYQRIAQIFGFCEVESLTPNDIFVWKRFYKRGNERDYDKEVFFKLLNLSVHA